MGHALFCKNMRVGHTKLAFVKMNFSSPPPPVLYDQSLTTYGTFLHTNLGSPIFWSICLLLCFDGTCLHTDDYRNTDSNMGNNHSLHVLMVFFFVDSPVATTALSIFGFLLIDCTCTSTYLMTSELFPTVLR